MATTPGSGPRHLAFGRTGQFLYLANELTGTVTVFAYDPKSGNSQRRNKPYRRFPRIFTATIPKPKSSSTPHGKFLYVSNRGDQTNSITVFRISATDGTLEFVQSVPSEGKAPRNFAIDPTGRWLLAANQESNNIQIFRVDNSTGHLSPTTKIPGIVAPVCVVFVAEE